MALGGKKAAGGKTATPPRTRAATQTAKPGSPAPTPTPAAHAQPSDMSKTAQVQNQVDEVVGIMQDNIHKVMQRGDHLETLQNKTEDLQNSSLQFKRGANKVRREMWWKDLKLKLIIGGVVGVILIVIIVAIVKSTGN